MSDEAIREFWRFWEGAEADLAKAIEGRGLGEWVERISARVEAIDPHLDWEFGQGLHAQHYFCLSGKGNPQLRVTAERWRAAGPPDGAVFEFHGARPGGGWAPSWELAFGEVRFGLADFRFEPEEDDGVERIHVRVHHPSYAGADEALRATATYVALDSVLGEDDTERWLGRIDFAETPAPDALDLGGLAERVAELRARATGEKFGLLQGTLPSGAPALALVNRALKRVDHLLMDTHLEAVLRLLSPNADGLVEDDEADELNALEDDLLARLGPDAVYVGRETLEGTRVIHLHAAAGGPAGPRLEEWARAVRAGGREVELRARDDPTWDVLHRW